MTVSGCRIKIHKGHLEKKDCDVAPCKRKKPLITPLIHSFLKVPPILVNFDPMVARDMLIMASSQDACKHWVTKLKRRVESVERPERAGLPR